MKKKGLTIAIDGPSGAGKSTVARLLAKKLDYIYIDTGAMYRAVGWKTKQEGIDPSSEGKLAALCMKTAITIQSKNNDPRIFADGIDVSEAIRAPEMGMMASLVSQSPGVRARLLILQRKLGKNGGVVMDGRDIGTVVFPDAEIKFFLDASPEERGRRRYLELKAKGMNVDLAQITKGIQDRDQQDSSRSLAPLKKADDAILIDSTKCSIEETIETMMKVIAEKLKCQSSGQTRSHGSLSSR
ncbi:MAG: (d)CMP kinase [Nitrospirota bacterium]